MKKNRHLRGTLFDIERELRTRNSSADEAISGAMGEGGETMQQSPSAKGKTIPEVQSVESSLDEPEPTKDQPAAAATPATLATKSPAAAAPAGDGESPRGTDGLGKLKEKTPDSKKVEGAKWLEKLISSDTRWNEIQLQYLFIPGSHDTLMSTGKTEGKRLTDSQAKRMGATQYFNIQGQLQSGYRYFDIRLDKYTEDSYRGQHQIKGGIGAVGEDWEETINYCYKFLDTNPKEFIILRIDKSSPGFEKALANKEIERRKKRMGRLYSYGTSLPGRKNLATTQIGKVIGKIIIVTNHKPTYNSSNKEYAEIYEKCFNGFVNTKCKDTKGLNDTTIKTILKKDGWDDYDKTKIFGGYAFAEAEKKVNENMVDTIQKSTRRHFKKARFHFTVIMAGYIILG